MIWFAFPVFGIGDSVSISETTQETWYLGTGEQLLLTISSWPMFVILPSLTDLSVTVYGSSGAATNSFSTPTEVFAIYFSMNVGRINFLATSTTTLKYFAIKNSLTCNSYYVSSAPIERWSAYQSSGNFTLGHYQDVCLFHVSDFQTNVNVNYNTELYWGRLYYQYSGSTSTTSYYTWEGNASNTSTYYSVFGWHSDYSVLSSSFSVELFSPSSTLPNRNCQGSGQSSDPIIMITPAPTRSRSSSLTATQSEYFSQTPNWLCESVSFYGSSIIEAKSKGLRWTTMFLKLESNDGHHIVNKTILCLLIGLAAALFLTLLVVFIRPFHKEKSLKNGSTPPLNSQGYDSETPVTTWEQLPYSEVSDVPLPDELNSSPDELGSMFDLGTTYDSLKV